MDPVPSSAELNGTDDSPNQQPHDNYETVIASVAEEVGSIVADSATLNGRISSTATQLRSSLRHNEDLSRAVDGLQSSKASVEGLLKESRSTIGQLRSELSDRDMCLEALKVDYNRVNAQFTSLQEEHSKAEAKARDEINSLKAEQKALMESHQKALTEVHSNTLKELDDVRNRSKNEMATLKEEVLRMSRQAWTVQSESHSVAKQLKKVKDLAKSANAENAVLESTMAEKDKMYDEVEKELVAAKAVIADKHEAELASLREQLADREQRISALEDEKENADPQKLQKANGEIATLSAEVATLKKANSDLNQNLQEKVQSLTVAYNEEQKETANLKSKLSSTEDTIKQNLFFHEATIKQLRSDLDKSKADSSTLRAYLTSAETANKELKQRVEKLTLEQAAATIPVIKGEEGSNEVLQELRNEMVEKDKMLLIAAEEFRKANVACQSTRSALDEAKEKHAAIEHQLREKHSMDVQELEERIAILHQKEENREIRAQARENELEDMRLKNANFLQDVEGLKNSERALLENINQLNQSFSSLHSDKREVEKQLAVVRSATQTEIEALNNTIAQLNDGFCFSRDSLDAKLTENEELQKELATAKKGVKLLGSLLKEARSHTADHDVMLDKSYVELDKREATIVLLENQCASGLLLRGELEQCRDAAVQLQDEIKSLQQQNSSKDEQIRGGRFSIQELMKQVDTLRTELRIKTQEHNATIVSVESLNNSLKTLMSEKDAIEKDLAEAEASRDQDSLELKETVKELRSTLVTLEEKCDENEAKASNDQETLKSLQSEMKVGISELEGKVKSQDELIETLKSEMFAKDEKIRQLSAISKDATQEMQERANQTSKHIIDLNEKLSTLQSEKEQLIVMHQNENERGELLTVELKKELETVSKQYGDEKLKSANLKAELASTQAELETTRAQGEISNTELDRIRTQSDVEIKSKLDAINQLKEKINATESTIQSKEAEVKETWKKLEDTNKGLHDMVTSLREANSALQAGKETREAMLSDTQASNELLSRELKEERAKCETQATSITTLQFTLDAAQARYGDLQQMQGVIEDKMHQESADIKSQLESTTSERDSLRAELESALVQMSNITNNMIPSMNEKLESSDAEIKRLTDDLQSKVEQLQKQTEEASSTTSDLQCKIEELHESSKNAVAKQDSLLQELSQARDVCENMQNQIIPSLESQLSEARSANNLLTNDITEKNASLKQLRADGDLSQGKVDQLEQQLKARIKALSETLASIISERDSLRSELEAAKTEYNHLSSEVFPSVDAQLAEQQGEVKTLSESLATITSERDNLGSELEAVKSEYNNLSSEVMPSVEAQLAEAEAEVERVNKKFEVKESELQAIKNEFEIMEMKAQNELSEMKSSRDAVNERLESLNRDNNGLKDQIAGLQNQLETAQASADNYRMSISSKESELSDVLRKHQMTDSESRDMIESLQSEAAKAKKKYEDQENEFRHELTNLQEQLESVTLESQQLSQGLNESQTETTDLNESLKTGQEEIARLQGLLNMKEEEVHKLQEKVEQVDQLQMELTKTQGQLMSRSSQIEQLEKNRQNNDSQVEKDRVALGEAVKDLDTLRANLNQIEQEKKLLSEMLDRVTSAHEVVSRSKTEFEKRVEEEQETIRTMQQRIDALEQQLREKESAEKAQLDRSEVLRSSLESLEKKKSDVEKELESTRAGLEKEAAAHMEALANLREELSTAKQERDEERASSETQKSVFTSMEAQLDRVKVDMKAQIDSSRKQVEKLEEARIKLINQVQDMETAEEMSTKKATVLVASLDVMTSRCESVEARLKKQRKEFEAEERKLESEVEKLQDKLIAKDTAGKKLEEALKESEESIRPLTSRCESAEAKLKGIRKDKEKAESKLQSEMESLHERLDEANAKREESEKTLSTTLKKITNLTRDTIPGLRANVTQLKSEIKSLNKKLAEKEAEVSDMNEKVSRIDELQNELADSQKALSSVKTTRADKAEMEQLKKKVKSLEEEIAIQQPVINDYEALNKKYSACMRKLNVAKQKNKAFESKAKDPAADPENPPANEAPEGRGDMMLRSKRRATLSGTALGQQPATKKAKSQHNDGDTTMTLRSRNPMSNVSDSYMNTRGRR